MANLCCDQIGSVRVADLGVEIRAPRLPHDPGACKASPRTTAHIEAIWAEQERRNRQARTIHGFNAAPRTTVHPFVVAAFASPMSVVSEQCSTAPRN